MNQFWSLLPSVDKIQEQAANAATKAQNLAKEFVEKTQDAATVAATNARQLTKKMAEEARGLTEEGSWKAAASKAKQQVKNALKFTEPFTSTSWESDSAIEELEQFGINTEFREFVRNLDYSTFREFSDADLDASVGFVLDKQGVLRLNSWQEKHAVLMLQVSNELDHLRYLLCPKRMSEEKFWLVYFSLAHTYLPAGCKTGVIPVAQRNEQITLDQSEVTKELELPLKEVESEQKEPEEEEEDDLDKYLNDVLEEGSNREHSTSDSFDNLDEFMDELNSQKSGDVLEQQSEVLKQTSGEKGEENNA
eukprot:g611.t1